MQYHPTCLLLHKCMSLCSLSIQLKIQQPYTDLAMAVQNLIPECDSEGRPFKEDFKVVDPDTEVRPWKKWKELISPSWDIQGHSLQRPGGHQGSYSPLLEDEINAKWKGCGVYELGLKNKGHYRPIVSFYVGSTCREGTDHSLGSRIFEYVRNGSHKAELINKAVDHRLTVYVRVVQTEDDDEARDLEQQLLTKYNYAWNDVNNGQIREDAIYKL